MDPYKANYSQEQAQGKTRNINFLNIFLLTQASYLIDF